MALLQPTTMPQYHDPASRVTHVRLPLQPTLPGLRHASGWAALALPILLFACDTQAPPRGTFRATVNGEPLKLGDINFALFEAPTQIGDSASHAVPNIISQKSEV